MHTQSHWSCSKCHKSVRKVIKEIPFLSEFWQKIFFFPDYSWRRRELLWCRKNEKEAKSRLHKIFCNCTKDQKNGLCKKRKNVSLFLKTTFQVRKSVWTFEFHFCNCLLRLLDQWKTAKENIFLLFLEFPQRVHENHWWDPIVDADGMMSQWVAQEGTSHD